MAAPTVILACDWTSASSFAVARVGPCVFTIRLNETGSSTGTAAGDDWHLCELDWTVEPISGQTPNPRYNSFQDFRRPGTSVTFDESGGDAERVKAFGITCVLTEGSWRVRLTVTNADGETAYADWVLGSGGNEPAVAANNYTSKYVHSGTGTNTPGGGNTPEAPYATMEYAISDNNVSNIKLTVMSGHAEQYTSNVSTSTRSNWWFVYEGSTDVTAPGRPRLTALATSGGTMLTLGNATGSNIVIENLTFVPATVANKVALAMNGRGIASVHMYYEGLQAGNRFTTVHRVSKAGGVEGSYCCVLNAKTEYYNSYFAAVATDTLVPAERISGYTILGCDIGISTNESGVRTTGVTDDLTVAFTKIRQDGSKSCIRFAQGRRHWAHAVVVEDGEIQVGVASPGGEEGVELVQVTGCQASGQASAGPLLVLNTGDISRCRFVNNGVRPDANVNAISGDASPDPPIEDVLIAHNTLDMVNTTSGVSGVAALGFSPSGNATGIEYRNNAIYMPSDMAANSRAIKFSSVAFGADSITGNVVTPDAETPLNTNAYEDDGVAIAYAAFVATAEADSTNEELSFTVGSDFTLSVTKTKARVRGCLRDMYNRPRAAQTQAGAIANADEYAQNVTGTGRRSRRAR